jgi:hypothetical protein
MADEKSIATRNALVSDLWKSTWKGFTNILEQAPQAWRGPDARLYRDEQEWITQSVVNPVFTGVFASTFCFITFRVSASRWWTRLQKTYFAKYQQLPPRIAKEQSTASQQQQPWRSTFLERETEKRRREISELSQLPIDLLLSILLGLSSFFLVFDSTKFRREFSSSPLLPGKSLFYLHVCPEVTSIYQQQALQRNKEKSTSSTTTADDETLLMFEIFVKNCQIRSAYIQNQTGNRPDVVPYPGLAASKRQESS